MVSISYWSAKMFEFLETRWVEVDRIHGSRNHDVGGREGKVSVSASDLDETVPRRETELAERISGYRLQFPHAYQFGCFVV